MTELAETLGIELEDFLVETGDLTDKQINQILHRCVTLGAVPYEFIEGYEHQSSHVYDNCYEYLGLFHNQTTVTNQVFSTILRLKDLLEMLQLKPMCSNGELSYIPKEDADLLLSMGSPVQDNNKVSTTLSKLDTEIEVLERTLSSLKNIRNTLK